MRYKAIDSKLFSSNRTRFVNQMSDSSIAIFTSNDLMPRNGDTYHKFRQNSSMFYLSGIDQEESFLVIFKDGKGDSENKLFIKETNEHIAIWEGEKLSKEQASINSGISKVDWNKDVLKKIEKEILSVDTIYLNGNGNDRFATEVESADGRLLKRLKKQYPNHSFNKSQEILRKLQMVKSEMEVSLISHASSITEAAFLDVLKTTGPEVFEYEIEAAVINRFIKSGANGHAYEPIIASGANACVLHYIENSSICNSGELILMDFGAEYANYASDLSRTIPVSGKFSARQKQVYQSVLRVKNAAESMMTSGMTMTELNNEVGELMTSELIDLKLINKKDVLKQDTSKPEYKKYFMHGIGHHMGLDVHDLADRSVPFEPGMVITCEPGIYIREEGLGVRLEDDILITDSAAVNLMKSIPIEIDHIESIMNA